MLITSFDCNPKKSQECLYRMADCGLFSIFFSLKCLESPLPACFWGMLGIACKYSLPLTQCLPHSAYLSDPFCLPLYLFDQKSFLYHCMPVNILLDLFPVCTYKPTVWLFLASSLVGVSCIPNLTCNLTYPASDVNV